MDEDFTTPELPPAEFLQESELISLKLYDVMESVGFTVHNRCQMKKSKKVIEIIVTSLCQRELAVYAVGSQYEGTTCLPDTTADTLQSDGDFALIYPYPRVVTRITNTMQENCLLLVEDESTPPGYAKLQQVQNGVPLTRSGLNCFDRERNPFLSFHYDNENRLLSYFEPFEIPENVEWNGPAVTYPSEKGHMDNVYGLQCKYWPKCVREWPRRRRYHGWPSVISINRCRSMGCLLVPMGHPNSKERNLQCKVSTALQERLLVTQFNTVQLKCYILLKLIKNENLPQCIEEETLTSYHCKQCMLFMVENTPIGFWKPGNLVGCLVASLRMLQKWAKNGHCPNYFIPEENLFDGRVPEERRQELFKILKQIATDIKTTLQKIQCGSIGMFLQWSFPLYSKCLKPKITILKIDITCRNRNKMLEREYDSNTEVCVDNFEWRLCQLNGDMEMTGKTKEEIKAVTMFVLPFIQPTLLSNMAALMVKQGKSKNSIKDLFSSGKYYQMLSTANDHLQYVNVHIDSSELKQASLLYMLEYFQEAKDILKLSKAWEIFSVCSCKPKKKLLVPHDILEATNNRLYTASDEYFKTIKVSPCVVFVPSEIDITPLPIKYELLQHFSSGENVTISEQGRTKFWKWKITGENPEEDFLQNWGIVDGQFLRHFLLYLSHTKLELTDNSKADIKNMEMLINYGRISHRETCLNLLGWIYMEQKHMNAALQCFIKSLQEQSTLNAAAWHLFFLVCDVLKQKNTNLPYSALYSS